MSNHRQSKIENLKFSDALTFPSLVQIIDKTTFVELFDEPHIDKVLGLGGFCFRVSFRQRFENFFDSLQAWILFLGKFVVGAGIIIGSFQDLLVLQREVLRQGSPSRGRS